MASAERLPDDDTGSEARAAEAAEQHVVILSGLSGGGKTAAAKLFEDLGYTVVDNLPGELLPELADLVSVDRERFARVAIVVDIRAGDDVLIRRFSETRHRHPLADQKGIASSIIKERRLLSPLRTEADVVIDTSDLSLRELREKLFTHLTDVRDADTLAVQLISFGYKYGVPLESD